MGESQTFRESELTEQGPKRNGPLFDVYQLVHEKDPNPDMTDLDIAEGIIEVLDDQKWVSADLAKESAHVIMQMRDPKNPEHDARAKRLILDLESGILQKLYPELEGIDEVHMDQEEYCYNTWIKECPEKS